MFLKRLEIHGFKSFANKTTLEFDKGIIAIVGPNGSGKSNVADSLRWVLGEQSAKLMRGKKSEDVIFAGSDKKTRLGFAEVFATFDNRDRRIPVDSSEVSIGRRIDRSGESEYLINGNKVRLLDIVDLVLKSNIGTSRYTVIGQGTIDQMILAGSGEVKNLLDEASGVKTYYIKREKTLRRLEQTAQNLMRAEDLMHEIEPRLKSLRRQAKKMEARAEIEQELRVYQREYFGNMYWQLKIQLDVFTSQLDEILKHRKELEVAIFSQRSSVEFSENNNREEEERFRAIQEQVNRLQGQKNKLLEDLSLVRGKMQGTKTASSADPETLQVELHTKESLISEIKQKIKASETERDNLHLRWVEQRKNFEEFDRKLKQLYVNLKTPVTIDWSLFDLEFKSVENTFQDFFGSLDNAQSVGDIKPLALNIRQSLEKFKHVVENTIRHPEQNMQNMQKELDLLTNQKDEIGASVANAEVGISKAKLSLEFLERQLGQLEQERLHISLELKKVQSGSHDDFWQSLTSEESRIKTEVEGVSSQILEIEQSVKDFMDASDKKQKSLREAETSMRNLQDELSKVKDKESAINIEKAKLDTQMEVLVEEIRRILGVDIFSAITERKIESSTDQLAEKITRLKNQLDMIGGMDDLMLKEYHETETRFTNLETQIGDLKHGMQDLRSVMDELDEHIKKKFNEAFHKINDRFEHYFRLLFNGGRAYLSVVRADDKDSETALEPGEETEVVQDSLRPEERVVQKYEKGASNIIGVDIKATPPGKKLSNIQAL